MPATLYPIEGRTKQFELDYCTAADFNRGRPEAVPARRVLDEPGWSPYFVDAEAAEMHFVRLPPAIDLATVPFCHLTQYLEAEALLTMSFGDVADMASGLPDPVVILIFSIGRCGTTLVSHALNGAANVQSLSEPACFEHRPLRALAARGMATSLVRSLCRLLFATRHRASADTLAVKFRSQALFVAPVFRAALPKARYLFMYRDALSWGESFYQFLTDVGMPNPPDENGRRIHWMMATADTPLNELGRFMDLDERPIAVERMLAAPWVLQLERYSALLEQGLPFLALRYNELMADRHAELERVLTHCGLPVTSISEALKAFDQDSQEGTVLARKGPKLKFDATGRKAFLATLARVPAFADPDLILPDIYSS